MDDRELGIRMGKFYNVPIVMDDGKADDRKDTQKPFMHVYCDEGAMGISDVGVIATKLNGEKAVCVKVKCCGCCYPYHNIHLTKDQLKAMLKEIGE